MRNLSFYKISSAFLLLCLASVGLYADPAQAATLANRPVLENSAEQIRTMENMMAQASIQNKRIELDLIRRNYMSGEQRAELNSIDVKAECAPYEYDNGEGGRGSCPVYQLQWQKFIAKKEQEYNQHVVDTQAKAKENIEKQIADLTQKLVAVNQPINIDAINSAAKGSASRAKFIELQGAITDGGLNGETVGGRSPASVSKDKGNVKTAK